MQYTLALEIGPPVIKARLRKAWSQPCRGLAGGPGSSAGCQCQFSVCAHCACRQDSAAGAAPHSTWVSLGWQWALVHDRHAPSHFRKCWRGWHWGWVVTLKSHHYRAGWCGPILSTPEALFTQWDSASKHTRKGQDGEERMEGKEEERILKWLQFSDFFWD